MNNTTGTTVPSFAQSDAVNLTKAKRNHGELMDMLDHLSGKLSHVSSTVDKEFLSAYRVHMLSVQAELKSLKNDVSKGEQMLNSDAQVAKLEKESKWFSGKSQQNLVLSIFRWTVLLISYNFRRMRWIETTF